MIRSLARRFAVARPGRSDPAPPQPPLELSAVLDSATEISIIATDPDGVITLFNAGAERLLGYTAGEMVGRHTPEVIHAPAEMLQRGRDLSDKLGRPVSGFDVVAERARLAERDVREWTYVRKDGTTLTANLAVTTLRDAGGAISGFLVIAHDVSQSRRVEQQLRDAHRFLNATLDALPACIAILDAAGTIIAVNEPWRRTGNENLFLGAALGIGANYLTACEGTGHGDGVDAGAVASGIRDVLCGERSEFYCEYAVQGPSQRRWLAIRVTPFAYADQTHVVLAHEDITLRRLAEDELRATQEWLQLAVEGSHTGLWDWDIRSNRTHYSSSWKQQLGYRHDDFGGTWQEWMDIVHPDDRERLVASVLKYLRNPYGIYTTEFRLRHKDGSYRWMLSRATMRSDGSGIPTRMLGAHIDITEAKRAEIELRDAKDTAERANRAKSDFVATISHEIRTPMNGVIGMTELLLQTALGQEQRECAETIRTSGQALLSLINDILDFSKIEAGRLELEFVDFDLRQLVEDAVDLLGQSAQLKGLELASWIYPEVPCELRGDPGRLRQILLNLIGNAVKFTERGEVIVRVRLANRGADQALLRYEVSDTGIGIARDRRERLFEAFAQADPSTTRRYGGTGLGLAISKRLIELMGGEIGVDSDPGRGSTFWFTARFNLQSRRTMPQDRRGSDTPIIVHTGIVESAATTRSATHTKSPHPPSAATSLADASTAASRILVAEDNAVNQKVVVHMLEKLGYCAEVATNGREAITAIAHSRYDAILMDCRMPEMDGFEATTQIRMIEAQTVRRTPIIAVTANAMQGDRDRCLAAGMDDYLSKPIQPRELRAVLQRWVHPRDAASNSTPEAINRAELARRLDGNRELIDAVVQVFLDEYPRLLEQLRDGVARGDAAAVTLAAHTLKGAASNLAADRVVGAAARLESAARGGDLSQAAAIQQSLESEITRLHAALETFS